MTECDGEHVPRPEPERGASLVCRVPPAVFELERAAS